MKEFRLSIHSKLAKRGFGSMLSILDTPLRYRVNNPEKVIRGSGVQEGDRVLELGCGSGFFTVAASKAAGRDGHIHSTDLIDAAIDITREKVSDHGLENVTVSQADAHNTGLPGESYDKILLLGVVPAPVISMSKVAEECHRLLEPKGQLSIWTGVPFWSPKSVTKTGYFQYLGKYEKVHRFEKKEIGANSIKQEDTP